ncbi:MAG: hypothetical protein ACO2PL_12110 [Armatimonadota bacterium]
MNSERKGKESGQGTGKMAKRRHGETGKRRNFTPLRITIYALRITNHASRLASSEWFLRIGQRENGTTGPRDNRTGRTEKR